MINAPIVCSGEHDLRSWPPKRQSAPSPRQTWGHMPVAAVDADA